MSEDAKTSLSGSDLKEGVLHSAIRATNNLDDNESQMHTTFQLQSYLQRYL